MIPWVCANDPMGVVMIPLACGKDSLIIWQCSHWLVVFIFYVLVINWVQVNDFMVCGIDPMGVW